MAIIISISLLIIIGIAGIIFCDNLIKKLIALGIVQTAIILLFVSSSYVAGALAPILNSYSSSTNYVNPLPHVLMLTAIVVGLATLSLGLAMSIKISRSFGSSSYHDITTKQARYSNDS